MGLIIFIVISVIILILKVSSNVKGNLEDQRIMDFLATSKHNASDIRNIADWEYELRVKIGVSQVEFDGGKICERQHFNTVKECLSSRDLLLEKYQVTEEEVEKYFSFIYLDKNGKLKPSF